MSWNELSLKDKADYIKESVNNGIYNLSDIRNRYNMYANGGYKPSESIKKRITNWEGSSMRTNRSFQAEANDFNRVIPSSIRSKLSQQQLDALYSYGYNVGMGNLKKRVLPTLTNYVQGKASNEDVQKSMWASKDNELRGLTTRRNIERSLFGGKYQTVFTGTGGTPHNYGYITNKNSSNPYQIQNEEWQGKNYLDAYKGLQLSMNDIMGKTKETDIDDLFSTGIGPIISMDNLLSIGNNTVAPVQPDYSYAKSLLSDFDSDLNSNIFAEGGNKDNNRTAMPAHPATNPYKRRSWETNEEYKERIQDLDNKSQEVALNDSTAINKYKEWEANIQKQQKINEEKSKAITIEKNTKRAKTLEKEFNSLRNIPSQISPNDTIQVINKNIPEAYKQQYINNVNMYKPALDTIDLGVNLYSLYNHTVPILSAGLLTNGLQFGQSIVDDDLGATDYSALAFDTLGLLGATNKLPTRLRIGKNRFWNIDKTADYLGVGQNILDSASDVYDLSKTGYHLYNNKDSNNLYISPFKKSFAEGGNKDDENKARHGTAVPYKRIHINEDGTFTDILTGKVYNTSATNGEDVVITGKANHWKEAGKRNINSYSPYSSIEQIVKDYLYKKLDNWVDNNVLEPNNYDINKIRRTLYNKLDPFGYEKKDSLGNVIISPDQKIKTALNPKTPNRDFLKDDVIIMRNPIYAKYLGLKDYYNGYSMVNTDDNLKISNYSPTIGNQGNIYYKSPTESDSYWGPFSDTVLARAFKTRDNKGKNTFVSPHYDDVMGHYTTSFGKDNKGKYISYYDVWDLNPFKGTPIENGDIGERYGIGKPVYLYNRKYYTDADSIRIMNKYNRLHH